MKLHSRFARPATDPHRPVASHEAGQGLRELGRFEDPDGRPVAIQRAAWPAANQSE